MRQRFKKVAEAVYFGPKPEPVAPLPATIPVSMQGNELAKKYVQNCKLMDQYADYTEKLETKYTDLYMAHAEMKKAIRDDERLLQASQFYTIQALHKHAGDFNAS